VHYIRLHTQKNMTTSRARPRSRPFTPRERRFRERRRQQEIRERRLQNLASTTGEQRPSEPPARLSAEARQNLYPPPAPIQSSPYFHYPLSTRLFVLCSTRSPDEEQNEIGYRIVQRLHIDGKAAYRLAGAFLRCSVRENIYLEENLISTAELNELFSVWPELEHKMALTSISRAKSGAAAAASSTTTNVEDELHFSALQLDPQSLSDTGGSNFDYFEEDEDSRG